jgi:4-amino-4-deoxy-L-arabinose transferase-like glycosyltransferase
MRIEGIIQTAIHKMEVGGGQRYLRYFLLALAIFIIGLRYDFHAYKNMFTPEGMDAAQLAHNIADGKGYTTQFIRPFSLYLVQSHNQENGTTFSTNATSPDFARIKTVSHPDIANPPVYPVMLAGLMKLLPFHFTIELKKSFWNDDNGKFAIYQPDFLIAIFNQLLLLIVVFLTFLIARKLFDSRVAWLSAILVFSCDLLWRFSTSGIPTILLLLIFLALIWCVLKIEELARSLQPRVSGALSPQLIASKAEIHLLGLSAALGALTGIGALTRYAFGWTIIPVAVFLILFSGGRRALHVLAAVGAFALLMTPWIIRNEIVSGTPFGTAGYAIMEGTFLFPHFRLERSIHPDLTHALWLTPYLQKLVAGGRDILENGLSKIGGSWASMFFLAGLLLQFRGIAIRRMRYFLLMCLGIFIVVQSLGQTYLSTESPDVNSENLLVLLAPMIFIYGVSLFFTLLDQMTLPALQLRYVVMTFFAVICCLPMIFALAPFRNSPIAYPPYYPPEIQQTAGWLMPNELEMSDVPWAVAWYGNRQCVWLTLDAQSEFFAINDEIKNVRTLYLTPETMDGKFLSDWIIPHDFSWGSFIIQAVTQNQLPPNFPLHYAPPKIKFLPERMFLADSELWKMRPDTVK